MALTNLYKRCNLLGAFCVLCRKSDIFLNINLTLPSYRRAYRHFRREGIGERWNYFRSACLKSLFFRLRDQTAAAPKPSPQGYVTLQIFDLAERCVSLCARRTAMIAAFRAGTQAGPYIPTQASPFPRRGGSTLWRKMLEFTASSIRSDWPSQTPEVFPT